MPATDAADSGGVRAPAPSPAPSRTPQPARPPGRPSAIDWALVIGLSVVWGASFVSIRLGLESFGPLAIAAMRVSIAAAILGAVALAGPGLPPLRAGRVWLHALGFGILSNALPFSLLAWAERHVPSAFAGICMALVPLATLALATRFLGERLTPRRLAGLGLGLAGVVLLLGPGAFSGGGEAVARAACVASSVSYGCGAIVTRRCPPKPLPSFSAAALLIAAAILWPLTLLIEGPPRLGAASAASIGAVAYLGIMPTALATVIIVRVIRSAGPVFLSLSNYQVPVWSVIFGWAMFGEQLHPGFLLALGVILAGLVIGQRRPRPA